MTLSSKYKNICLLIRVRTIAYRVQKSRRIVAFPVLYFVSPTDALDFNSFYIVIDHIKIAFIQEVTGLNETIALLKTETISVGFIQFASSAVVY